MNDQSSKQPDIPIVLRIKSKLGDMTPQQRKIADFLLKSPEAPIRKSITQLALEIGVKSEASIVRFYRMLGLSGYHDFKVTLAQETAGRAFYHSYEDVTVDDSVETVIYKIFHGAALTLQANMKTGYTERYTKARDLLLSAKRIVFLGYATSASIASYAFFRFTDLGFNCHFSTDSHVNATLLAQLHPGDIVLAISHSGETRDITLPLEKLHGGVPIIAITGYEQSTLCRLAQISLVTLSDETNYRTDAMTSRIVQMTIVDSLFGVVILAMGESALEHLKKTRQALFQYKT
jgi:RpiR family carbohydrate utilization transcriptional regulator